MLIISKPEIKKIFSMKEAIAANKEALSLYSNNKTIAPLRTHLNMPKQNGQSLFMPAYVEDLDAVGIKVVSIFPENLQRQKPVVMAQMILLDATTGEVCAMLDGTYLTQLRTGALQGAATDLLSNKDAKIALLFGTGGQADAQIEAMLAVRNLQKIYVCGRDFEKTKSFVAQIQANYETEIIAVEEGDSVLPQADIITAATTSYTPVFDGELVKEGAHINGIGAYTPEMQELPAAIVKRANKIYFDTNEGVLAEAGDILTPLKDGIISHSDFSGEIGQVILGQILARESENEITLFKGVGTAILDVVMAQKIYQNALANNIGSEIVF
jgi:ornithine cyclodeaminase